jgi:hypothetical protein
VLLLVQRDVRDREVQREVDGARADPDEEVEFAVRRLERVDLVVVVVVVVVAAAAAAVSVAVALLLLLALRPRARPGDDLVLPPPRLKIRARRRCRRAREAVELVLCVRERAS